MRIFHFLLLSLVMLSTSLVAQSNQFSIDNTEVVDISDPNRGRTYQLYIKVPATYNRDSHQQSVYPAVYLTDALTAFPLASGASQVPMNAGKMQEAILVGISWEVGISPIDSRIRDFTPTVNPEWARETGGAEDHLNFIRDKVIPYMETNYRADSAHRIFSGHSLGGLFGAYIFATNPELFAGYILGSPSLWFDRKVVLTSPEYNQLTEPSEIAKVFIGVGELEQPVFSGAAANLVEDAQTYYDKLINKGKDLTTVQLQIIDGAIHETAYPATITQGLNWILGTDNQ